MQLDPKAVQLHPEGHLAQTWQVRLPVGVSYGDIFRSDTWAYVEKTMRQRGPKRPRTDDLLRVIGSGFDVVCLIVSVGDGFGLEFYAGRRPSPVAQVLDDLDALPNTASAADIKERAKVLRQRWAAAGICREDIASARRTYAKNHHPDTNRVDGQRLAAANSILDAALTSIQEAA
jgi:hypothetical protein